MFRVHQCRKVSFRQNQHDWCGVAWPVKLGHQDQWTIWRKTTVPSRTMSRAAYAALPDTLVVRELRYRIVRRGYRTRTVTRVTTLLDAERYPKAELADLYYRRWQAEINLRDLKDTLGLRVLRAQTVAGVEREVLAFALLYNLLCAVRTVIAVHLETAPARVSLLDVVRLLCCRLDRVADAAIVVNLDRPGRVQPRVVKRRPLGYSRMTRPRRELKQKLLENGWGVT